jgi:hypothetical protein
LANLLGTPSLAPQNRKAESGGATKPAVPASTSPAVAPPTVVESEPAPTEAFSEPMEISGKPEKSRLKSSWDAVASFFGVAPTDPESKLEATVTGSTVTGSTVTGSTAASPLLDGGPTEGGMANRGSGKKTKSSMWGEVESAPPAAPTDPAIGANAEVDRPRGPSRRASEPRGQEPRNSEPRNTEARGGEGRGGEGRGGEGRGGEGRGSEGRFGEVKAMGGREADGRNRDDSPETGIGSDRRSHRRLPRRGRGENPEIEFAPRGTSGDEGIGRKSGFGAESVDGGEVDIDSRDPEAQSSRRDSDRGRRERRPADRESRGDRDRRDRPERDESDRKDVASHDERLPSSRRQGDSEPMSDRPASESRRGGRRSDARSDATSSDADSRDVVARDHTEETPRRGPRSGQSRGGEPRASDRAERSGSDRGDRVERSSSERGDRVERSSSDRGERVVRGDRGDRSERGERGRTDRDGDRTVSDRSRSDRPVVDSTRKHHSERSEGSKSASPKEGRRGPTGFGAGISQGGRDEFVGDEFDDRLQPGDEFDEVVDDRDLDDRDLDDRDLDDGVQAKDDFADSDEAREKRPRRRRRRGGKDRERDGAEDASRPRSHHRDEDRDGPLDEVDDEAEDGIRLSKIPSWAETIMVVVESNIANHQRTPQGGRGPSRGRGRR